MSAEQGLTPGETETFAPAAKFEVTDFPAAASRAASVEADDATEIGGISSEVKECRRVINALDVTIHEVDLGLRALGHKSEVTTGAEAADIRDQVELGATELERLFGERNEAGLAMAQAYRDWVEAA